MKGEGSMLELVSADYQPAKLEGTEGFHVTKEIKVSGSPESVVARAMVVRSGKFVIEFNFIMVPGDAESDRALGTKTLEVLKKAAK